MTADVRRLQVSRCLILALMVIYVRECSAQAKTLTLANCPTIIGGSCPDPGIRFILYTRSTPQDGLQIPDDSLPSEFDKSLPTKVLIHGFNEGMTVLYSIRDAYLQKGAYNIIMVDWNKYARSPCYPMARVNANFSGKCTAHFIKRLNDQGVNDVHIIGVSLGAHVAGYTGRFLKPNKPPRITGLDPASPLFEGLPNDLRLDKGDAEFVDIIHTNALIQGQAQKLGHVDFYVNGGTHQPGCNTLRALVCDHLRSVAFFAESILAPDGFWAWKCSGQAQYALGMCPRRGDEVLMGEFVDKSARGFYVTKTRGSSPYALGRKKAT